MAIEKKRLLRFLVLSAILIIIMVTVPKTIGLSREGFDVAEVLRQYFFYAVTGIASMLGLFFLFFYENKEGEDDDDYGSGLCYSSPGEKPAISFFKSFTSFQIFLASFILFCTIGLFTYLTKQASFTGLATLAMQFTEIDSLLFSSFLIPVAENLDLAFVIAISIFGLRYYARKYDWQPITFQGFSYIIIIFGGLFGLANHLLRYSGSDVAKVTVIIFWMLGTALTLFTGSFLPFLCMHFANNFFFDLGRFLSSEVMLIYSGAALILLGILYFVIYNDRLLGRPGGV